MITIDEFFVGYPESRRLFDALLPLVNGYGETDLKVKKSQIAFKRKKSFAWVWVPGRYLRGKVALLVLSISLKNRDPSPRWKEIVELAQGQHMHHLELYTIKDIDDDVRGWLRRAWELAG